MASYWPAVPDSDPYAQHLDNAAKYVATTTLEIKWRGSTSVAGDVPAEVARLKQQSRGAAPLTTRTGS